MKSFKSIALAIAAATATATGAFAVDASAADAARQDTTVILVHGAFAEQDAFWQQFASDVPEADAAVMASTQRPVAKAALTEASGQPRWKDVPSWFVYGDADRNIPAEALQYMADRAGSQGTVVVPGASHVVMTSQPQKVAALIDQAAQAATR